MKPVHKEILKALSCGCFCWLVFVVLLVWCFSDLSGGLARFIVGGV